MSLAVPTEEIRFDFETKDAVYPEARDKMLKVFIILYQPPGLDWRVVGQVKSKLEANEAIKKPYNLQEWGILFGEDSFMIMESF